MKKTAGRGEFQTQVLAVLSEEPLTVSELHEKFPRKTVEHVRVTLRRLAGHGKVRKDGDRWRIHGPSVSPLREEIDPQLKPDLLPAGEAAVEGDDLQHRVLVELQSGPMSLGEVAANLGVPKRWIQKALKRAENAGRAHVEGHSHTARWRLGSGSSEPTANPRVKSKPVRVVDARTPRDVLLDRKRELEVLRDIALARLEEVDRAIEACA